MCETAIQSVIINALDKRFIRVPADNEEFFSLMRAIVEVEGHDLLEGMEWQKPGCVIEESCAEDYRIMFKVFSSRVVA